MSAVGWAQSEGESPLLIELLDEVNRLRQEVKELRSKNEELEHAVKVLRDSYQKHLMSQQFQHTATLPDTMSDRPTDGAVAVDGVAVTGGATATDGAVADGVAVADDGVAAVNGATADDAAAQSRTPAVAPGQQAVQQDDALPAADQGQATTAFVYPSKQLNDEEIKLYYAALQQLDKNNKSLRRDMKRFIKQYPSSVLVSGAHYWIAESYYDEQNYKQAASHYDVVIRRYKDSRNYNDARLKRAYIHYEQQEWQQARNLFVALSKLDDDNLSSLAQSRLDSMDKEDL